MKKTYHIPATCVTRIQAENLVATSLTVDTTQETDVQYVKDNNTPSRSSYSVWDDDWSR